MKSKIATIGIYVTDYGDVVLNPKVSKLIEEINKNSMRDGRQKSVKESRVVLSSIEFALTTLACISHNAGIELEDIFVNQKSKP
jgi:hypothetical protein